MRLRIAVVPVPAALAALFVGALVALAPTSARPAVSDERPMHLGATPLELVGTRDSLWLLTCDRRCSGEARTSAGRIVRIDSREGRVLASAPISRPQALAVGSGGVYAVDFWRDTVIRLDPETLRTTARLRLVLPFEVVPGMMRSSRSISPSLEAAFGYRPLAARSHISICASVACSV
jgi:hypothetical protein